MISQMTLLDCLSLVLEQTHNLGRQTPPSFPYQVNSKGRAFRSLAHATPERGSNT